jgi:hypothetical protein
MSLGPVCSNSPIICGGTQHATHNLVIAIHASVEQHHDHAHQSSIDFHI